MEKKSENGRVSDLYICTSDKNISKHQVVVIFQRKVKLNGKMRFFFFHTNEFWYVFF